MQRNYIDREGTEDVIERACHEHESHKTEGGHIRNDRIEDEYHQLDPVKIPQQEDAMNSPCLEESIPLVAPEQDEDQESRDRNPRGMDPSKVLGDNMLISHGG